MTLAANNLTGERSDLIDVGHQICAKIKAGKDTGSSNNIIVSGST